MLFVSILIFFKFFLSYGKNNSTVDNCDIGKIINTTVLNSIIDIGNTTCNYKIFDCSYIIENKPNVTEFMEKYYGNIDVLMNNNSISKHLYELAHIPGAYFFDISVAMYPGVEERFSFYPVNIFQEYIRKIGINNNDHLILYSRGSMGGNMFAARCFYLLEMYGFKSMSLLSGGFNKWMKDGFIEDEGFEDYMGEGDFVGERDFEMTVSYDELTTKNNEGKDMFDRAGDDVTFIDARPFTDYQKSHIINAVNLPVIETINDDGTIKEANEILQIAGINNVTFTQPIVVYCNTGTQASLLAFIIENVIGMKVRLYNGGFTELKVKDSSRFT